MTWSKEEVYLNIYPTKYNCKIIFFRQDKNKIDILSEIDKKIAMNNRVFIEKSVRNEYIKEISTCIINEKLKYKKCKSVFINIQENDVIVKNIKIDSAINKKDLIKAVDIEIKEFSGSSFNNYCIDYKRLNDIKEETDVQVVLFPKKYIDLFSELCDQIGIEKRAMHTNFDLLGRLIKRSGGESMKHLNGELGVVEFRPNDLVISIFYDCMLKNSYVLKKEEFNHEIGENIFVNCDSILALGKQSIDDIKIIQDFADIIGADFENDLEYTKNGKRVSAKEYFQIAAKMVN